MLQSYHFPLDLGQGFGRRRVYGCLPSHGAAKGSIMGFTSPRSYSYRFDHMPHYKGAYKAFTHDISTTLSAFEILINLNLHRAETRWQRSQKFRSLSSLG
jgi:hypothetical protein